MKKDSLTYCEIQRKPAKMVRNESPGPRKRQTFSVALSLNNRAHENFDGPDVGERNLALKRVRMRVEDKVKV